MELSRSKFVKNVMIMTLNSFVLSFIAMMFRSFVIKTAGNETVGLHGIIMSVYGFAQTVATACVGAAVTVLVAQTLSKPDRERQACAIVSVALRISLAIGLSVSVGLFFLSDIIGRFLLYDRRTSLPILILSLAIVFVSLSSVIRSYFIARKTPVITAACQICEQLVNVITAAALMISKGNVTVQWACISMAIGSLVGEAVSFLLAISVYLAHRARFGIGICASKKGIACEILKISMPMSIGTILRNGIMSTENILLPAALVQYGMNSSSALAGVGMIKGTVLPTFFFPASFIGAFATMIVPEISQALADKNEERIKKTIGRAIKITALCGSAVFAALMFFAKDVSFAISGSEESAPLMMILSPLIPFMYFESIADGMLRALKKQNFTAQINVADASMRVVLIITVVARFGLGGFIAVMYISNLLTSVLSYVKLMQASKMKRQYLAFIIPIIAAALAFCLPSLVISGILSLSSSTLMLIIKIATASVIYVTLLLVLGIIKTPIFCIPQRFCKSACLHEETSLRARS